MAKKTILLHQHQERLGLIWQKQAKLTQYFSKSANTSTIKNEADNSSQFATPAKAEVGNFSSQESKSIDVCKIGSQLSNSSNKKRSPKSSKIIQIIELDIDT